MQKIIRFRIAYLIPVLLLGIALTARTSVFGLSAGVSLTSSKWVLDIGETFTVSFTVQPDHPCLLQADVSVTGGLQVLSGSMNECEYNNLKFISKSGNQGVYRGSLTIQATSAGEKTIALTNVRLVDETNTVNKTVVSGSIKVYVRTEAERQQAIRQWQEEQRKAEEEAARQASIEASIAESRAIDISIAASIDESIKESVYEEESIRASIEESIQESESEVERTRPSEIGEVTFARYLLSEKAGEGPKYLYLMLKEHPVKIPEGFERADYSVNENEVLALRTKGMAKGVYLVYGMPENAERPAFYYLNTETNELFPYEYLNSDWVDEGPDPSGGSESETETEPTDESDDTVSSGETETTETKRDSVSDSGHLKRLIQIALLSFLLGTAIATLVAVLVKGKKQNTKAETVKEKPRSGEETPAFANDADAVTTATIEFEEIDDFGKPGSSSEKQEIDE